MLKLLKHVKLIVFDNYNECKTKHLFLIKKVVTRFDKTNRDMAEKDHWWREESITADAKENPINDKSKEDPYHCET